MKFVCDDNLGRLARWLRTLGFDTIFDRAITDDQVLSAALAENRTIVTRDHRLAEKTLARRAVLLAATDPLEQVVELVRVTGIEIDSARFFTRCPICNYPVEPIEKEDYIEEIPPYVYRTKDTFTRCSECSRIYWGGTHVDRMKEKLAGAGIASA